jgi:lysozyme
MKTSQRGIGLIKGFEGLRTAAYRCPAGILTVGYGHTGRDVTQGLVITEAQAEALLRRDLEHFEQAVTALAGDCTQGQFDALVAFAFNVGIGALKASSLLKRHRAGDFAGAANQFLRWDKAGKQVLPGLTKRRAAERALYLSRGE